MPTINVVDKQRAFRKMHESGFFVIPNPWDVGSARYLQCIGFKALATTSSGLAWANGLPDGQVPRDVMIRHLRAMVAATDVPVSADFQGGFADELDDLEESISLAIETGIAGLSIEDATGDTSKPIRDLCDAVARVRAVRKIIDRSGSDVLLVVRADNFFAGVTDLDDTIERLKAYSAAGADCLFAPGISTRQQIAAVVAAVAPKPVNVLVPGESNLTLQEIAELGVRRVSVGGALARAAWGGFMHAAQVLAEQERFDGFQGAPAGAQLNTMFCTDPHQ